MWLRSPFPWLREHTIPPAKITMAVITVALRCEMCAFSSKHFTGISRIVKYVDYTAKISAVKKKKPMKRPPGNFPNISFIARKIRDGPAVICEPEPTTEGMITNPAVRATDVSQIVTHIESFLMLLSSDTLAPSVVKIDQPIPTENITCIQASAHAFHVKLLQFGTR